eukprot:5889646-Amphidinium_carterae.1
MASLPLPKWMWGQHRQGRKLRPSVIFAAKSFQIRENRYVAPRTLELSASWGSERSAISDL